MSDEKSSNYHAASFVRWVARVLEYPSNLFLSGSDTCRGDRFLPHAPPPVSVRDVIGLSLFPFGVFLGILLAWRWERLGGIISSSQRFRILCSTLVIRRKATEKAILCACLSTGVAFFVFESLLDRNSINRKVYNYDAENELSRASVVPPNKRLLKKS